MSLDRDSVSEEWDAHQLGGVTTCEGSLAEDGCVRPKTGYNGSYWGKAMSSSGLLYADDDDFARSAGEMNHGSRNQKGIFRFKRNEKPWPVPKFNQHNMLLITHSNTYAEHKKNPPFYSIFSF